MKTTEFILLFKIAFTLIAWCVPLLFFPPAWFETLGFPAPQPIVLVRLLGASYLALTIGYYLGFKNLRHGGSAAPTLIVGVISNGAASLILLFYGVSGAWTLWASSAQFLMWLSFTVTGLIALALLRQLLVKPAKLS